MYSKAEAPPPWGVHQVTFCQWSFSQRAYAASLAASTGTRALITQEWQQQPADGLADKFEYALNGRQKRNQSGKKKEKYLQGLVTGRRKFIQRDWLFLFCNTNCNTARGSASENHNTQWMPLHLNADWRDATDASDTRETATAMSFPPLQKGCLPYTICKKS